MTTRPLHLGRARDPSLAPVSDAPSRPWELAAHHLVTHGVCVGMTGSGKTGLCVVLVEEALRSRVPVLVLDIKGDLANLLLTFPNLAPDEFKPWVDADAARRAGTSVDAAAADVAKRWSDGLARWSLDADDVRDLREGAAFRVITPGTNAAEPLHVLSALEAPSDLWSDDEEAARASLSAALSLLLRMIDHEADPSRSREHVLLALLAERRVRAGQPTNLEALVGDLQRPPIARAGALPLDDFLSPAGRATLAQDLNTLIASPTFSTWRQGAALDPGAWFAPREDGRTPAVILSVAHLDDAERMLVLSLVLEQLLAWVRSLPGTSDLRALVLFDEVFGFMPPHPAGPPTKRPLMALMKQARAFGVGVVLATQNPMDLDYKALSNAGVWFVGRLQTDADRERVVEGLAGTSTAGNTVHADGLGELLKALPGRTFYVRNVHDAASPPLLETRWTLSWLRGPLTRQELRRLARPIAPTAPTAPTSPIATPTPANTQHAPDNGPTAPVAPTREVPAARRIESPSAPAAPEGWRTLHAATPPGASPATWAYRPWVAATIVAHVRDARLGVQVNRVLRAMAPLADDGRPDTMKGRVFDPAAFVSAPLPDGRYAPLPDALFRKNGPANVERALRDEVYRSLQVSVLIHKDLSLVATTDETPQAFAQRVTAEARRHAALAAQEIPTRHAPRIQHATDEVTHARAALAAVESNLPTGGVLATGAALLRGGKRALARLETQQDRIAVQLTRARRDLAAAEATLREAVARRDAELIELEHDAQSAVNAIESRAIATKKDDIEVTEIAVAWVPTPSA
jgi:hypothetical protein